MPLYEFKCRQCEIVSEDILPVNHEQNPKCKCGGDTDKMVSRCLGIIPGSTNRTLDCVVGADADKRWAAYDKNKYRKKFEKKEV